jgi:hypothetical protein
VRVQWPEGIEKAKVGKTEKNPAEKDKQPRHHRQNLPGGNSGLWAGPEAAALQLWRPGFMLTSGS